MLKSIISKIKKLGSMTPSWVVFLFIALIFAMNDSWIVAGIFVFNAFLVAASNLIKNKDN